VLAEQVAPILVQQLRVKIQYFLQSLAQVVVVEKQIMAQ
jgi:hypothetical protein